MSAPAYMLSLLGRQYALLGADFFERYTSDWLVWEPGPWRPAKTMASSNTEVTHQPSSSPPARPEGEDALCFELKRVAGVQLSVGRATENDVVINDLTVSREQLILSFAERAWTLRGKNDQFVLDGQHVGPAGAVLKSGAVIQAGDVKLTFYGSEGFPERLQREAKKAR